MGVDKVVEISHIGDIFGNLQIDLQGKMFVILNEYTYIYFIYVYSQSIA